MYALREHPLAGFAFVELGSLVQPERRVRSDDGPVLGVSGAFSYMLEEAEAKPKVFRRGSLRTPTTSCLPIS